MAEQRKNNFQVEVKLLSDSNDPSLPDMKRKEKKVGFLYMELQDIKNNKGTMTLQVKSVEHLQTWLKKNEITQSELNIQPLDLTLDIIEQSINKGDSILTQKWWLGTTESATRDEESKSDFAKPRDFKSGSTQANDILELAKKQHMNTDIKKAVFQAIVGAEDYIQAFENCTRLNLKKQQEREIIKVLVHCCVNEKGVFNKFYALLAQRLCRYQP